VLAACSLLQCNTVRLVIASNFCFDGEAVAAEKQRAKALFRVRTYISWCAGRMQSNMLACYSATQ
jgi:hypothetical protein